MTADVDIIDGLRAAGLVGEGAVVLEPLTGGAQSVDDVDVGRHVTASP